MRRRNLLTEDPFKNEMTFASETTFGVAAWDSRKIDVFLADQNLIDDEQLELESANGMLLLPGSTAADPLNGGQT
jgi:hypothetical protein